MVDACLSCHFDTPGLTWARWRLSRMRIFSGAIALPKMATVLVALAMLGGVFLGVASVALAATSSGPSWHTVASRAHLTRPSAIAAIAGNDVWVVGSVSDSVRDVRTGAEHWNG